MRRAQGPNKMWLSAYAAVAAASATTAAAIVVAVAASAAAAAAVAASATAAAAAAYGSKAHSTPMRKTNASNAVAAVLRQRLQ